MRAAFLESPYFAPVGRGLMLRTLKAVLTCIDLRATQRIQEYLLPGQVLNKAKNYGTSLDSCSPTATTFWLSLWKESSLCPLFLSSGLAAVPFIDVRPYSRGLDSDPSAQARWRGWGSTVPGKSETNWTSKTLVRVVTWSLNFLDDSVLNLLRMQHRSQLYWPIYETRKQGSLLFLIIVCASRSR